MQQMVQEQLDILNLKLHNILINPLFKVIIDKRITIREKMMKI